MAATNDDLLRELRALRALLKNAYGSKTDAEAIIVAAKAEVIL